MPASVRKANEKRTMEKVMTAESCMVVEVSAGNRESDSGGWLLETVIFQWSHHYFILNLGLTPLPSTFLTHMTLTAATSDMAVSITFNHLIRWLGTS